MAKLHLICKGIEESAPRPVIKAFYRESDLSLDHYEALSKMIVHRNLLSHVYDPSQFEEIYSFFKAHLVVFQKALNALES